VAYAAGVILAHDRLGTGLFMAAAVIALVLLGCLGVAVGQARRMSRLRRALLTDDTAELRGRVGRGARSATALRATLGLLSLALVVAGAFLAV
jgi:hypothetical protein